MSAPAPGLQTPALLLDAALLDHNAERMRAVIRRKPGLMLRAHLKTAKSVEVARRVLDGPAPITVSTLLEAEQFFAAGYDDILYAVGIEPGKLARAADLIARGCRLGVILDNAIAAQAVIASGRERGVPFRTSIEIDTDGHRSGLKPDDPAIVQLGAMLHAAGLPVGVLTHAGESYTAASIEEIRRFAEIERSGAVHAADQLRSAGVPVMVVSVGSTPTALFGESFDGVTELRAGVYMFGDLVMAGLGVMRIDEIAISVLTSVIGHRPDRGWIIVDAGWMAMSRDRGMPQQAVDQGYGLVLNAAGKPIDDLIMVSANQEHGILADRHGRAIDLDRFPVGTRLRVLPNHACATAAQFNGYHVLGAEDEVWWPRFDGW